MTDRDVFPLTVLAGPDAIDEVREAGLRPERVRAFVGASGGPKWLVLHGLDRVAMPWLRAADRALHALGSSIGSWRGACLATDDPAAAVERFAEAYVEQRYVGRPSPQAVSLEGERILAAALGGTDPARLADHPAVRLHVVTTRFRHLGAREGAAQQLSLAGAFLANAVHRRALGGWIERVVFDAGGDAGPFAPWTALPTRHVPLTSANLLPALQASAAIPMVMSGVVDPPGAPPGTYRDGGVSDYHFGREIDVEDGLTLYPHFYPHVVPGWFDKALSWRRTLGLRRVVLIAPSAGYVERLPHRRIPDRKDFERLRDAERIACWRQVLAQGRALGDAFCALTTRGSLGDLVQPLP